MEDKFGVHRFNHEKDNVTFHSGPLLLLLMIISIHYPEFPSIHTYIYSSTENKFERAFTKILQLFNQKLSMLRRQR